MYVRARQWRDRLDASVVYLVPVRILHAAYLARNTGKLPVVAKLYPGGTHALGVDRAKHVRQEPPVEILPRLRVLDPESRDAGRVAELLVRLWVGRYGEELIALRRV